MSDFPAVDHDAWRARVREELKGAGLESLTSETLEGLVIAPLYSATRADAAGFPGLPPYVRGAHPRPRRPPWQRCQLVDSPELGNAVEVIEAERASGVPALWLRLDRAARLGVPPGEEEVSGYGGVVAQDAFDLERLIRAAGDGKLSLRLDAGGNALPAAAVLFAALERTGRETGSVRVQLGMDPLGALARDGELPGSAARIARECALLAGRAARALPGSCALSADGSIYARAGADAAGQLAFVLATAVQYLRWLEEHGVEPSIGFQQIDLVLETDRHFLLEVAKLRAARLLWSRVQRACGVEPRPPWIHVVSGWRTLTRRDPWTNLLRTTVQGAAAITGGADAITTLPFDFRLGEPSAAGRRLARNTQAILDEESGLGRILDPAGGAHAVEALTRELALAAWERFQALEAAGGMVACLQSGQVHEAAAEGARRRAERIQAGDRAVLGVSVYPDDAEPLERAPRDGALAAATARERLTERRGDDGVPGLEALEAAVGDEHDPARLGEALMAAARAGATIAELSATLRPGATRSRLAPVPARSDEELVAGPVAEEVAS